MKKEETVLKTLVDMDPERYGSVLKELDDYKRVSDIISRTKRALGRTKEYKETSHSAINLKISPNANGSTTNFQINPGLA